MLLMMLFVTAEFTVVLNPARGTSSSNTTTYWGGELTTPQTRYNELTASKLRQQINWKRAVYLPSSCLANFVKRAERWTGSRS